MKRCAICKSGEVGWTMQPFGPDDTFITFTVPGSHYRGFPAIGVCDDCRNAIKAGEQLRFRHRGTEHVTCLGVVSPF